MKWSPIPGKGVNSNIQLGKSGFSAAMLSPCDCPKKQFNKNLFTFSPPEFGDFFPSPAKNLQTLIESLNGGCWSWWLRFVTKMAKTPLVAQTDWRKSTICFASHEDHADWNSVVSCYTRGKPIYTFKIYILGIILHIIIQTNNHNKYIDNDLQTYAQYISIHMIVCYIISIPPTHRHIANLYLYASICSIHLHGSSKLKAFTQGLSRRRPCLTRFPTPAGAEAKGENAGNPVGLRVGVIW